MKRQSPQYFLKMAERIHWHLPGTLNWRTVRATVLMRDERKCRKCGGTEKLEVHHLNYPDWDLNELLTLCEPCHRKQPKRTIEKTLAELPQNDFDRLTGLVGYKHIKRAKEYLGSVYEENKRILDAE